MTDVGGGASPFEQAFMLVELAGACLLVLAVLRARDLGRGAALWVLGLAVLLTLGLPLGWNLLEPPRGGIAGAARLIVGGAGSLLNLLLASAFALRRGLRGPVLAYVLAVLGYWLVFIGGLRPTFGIDG